MLSEYAWWVFLEGFGRHYVSHGLIKLYGNNDSAYTIPHRTGKGVVHPVRPKNFKVNIVCQKPNTALSAADSTALEFANLSAPQRASVRCQRR